jgi:chloramphenicol 3-O phosphotransferase
VVNILEMIVDQAQVIVLNGVGSVGKSSTAQELQKITMQPFLHIAMDQFIDTLPPRLIGDPAGLVFETVDEGGRPSVVITTGPDFQRVMTGMRHAIAAMADEGNNLIVDDVLLADEARQYRALLSRHALRFVGFHAPLEVLERRERDRGDRLAGLARGQYDRVHRDIAYDLEIDTAALTPAQAAQAIRDAFGL